MCGRTLGGRRGEGEAAENTTFIEKKKTKSNETYRIQDEKMLTKSGIAVSELKRINTAKQICAELLETKHKLHSTCGN